VTGVTGLLQFSDDLRRLPDRFRRWEHRRLHRQS
jgi:hypothetical protein